MTRSLDLELYEVPLTVEYYIDYEVGTEHAVVVIQQVNHLGGNIDDLLSDRQIDMLEQKIYEHLADLEIDYDD
jgi:hypothetical protein